MKTKLHGFIALACLIVPICSAADSAPRTFVHPGITYTQADLDRMRAMVHARQEPFLTTFQALERSGFSQPGAGAIPDILRIPEGGFNGTVGNDGRRAHDMALLYRITGKSSYADAAVARLNRYNRLTNASSRGTAPLDNGKIFLLLEAAELLRDYAGWLPADQAAFKRMLTHPFYSTTRTPDGHWSLNDSLNDVSFYWNLFQFDPGRYGNQGLFAARGMLAMGVYLDNDTIYDRALRYLTGKVHRPDDLPYRPGPPVRTGTAGEDSNQITYSVAWGSDSADYHSDETLPFYIYRNGQCQESSRDQGHVMAGIGNYAAIAEIAWNQGDTLYGELDHRILTGIEYNLRYNLSPSGSFPDQPVAWEPTGSSTSEADVSFENGVYYQALSRSGRWLAKAISANGRGAGTTSGGWRTQALMHYSVRRGLDSARTRWLSRSYDAMIARSGFEDWGDAPSWYYEWTGWGTLTKFRTPWMAGDPGRYLDGVRLSGIPRAPCRIAAVDYDHFPGGGEGRTYHNLGSARSTIHRDDGSVEIVRDGPDPVVTAMEPGEWLSYGVVLETGSGVSASGGARPYNLYATYKASGTGARLEAAIEGGLRQGMDLEPASQWTERRIGTFEVAAGARTIRIFVGGKGGLLSLKDLRVEPVTRDTIIALDLATLVRSLKLYDGAGKDVSPDSLFLARILDGDKTVSVDLPSQRHLVLDFGPRGIDMATLSLFNDGATQDGREMAAVMGQVADTSIGFQGGWVASESKVFLRTNGTSQNGLAVPILDNSWTRPGEFGVYSVGPVGRWRYLDLYNWSARLNVSELEVRSVVTNRINASDTASSSTSPFLPADLLPSPHVVGRDVRVPGAIRIEAYSTQGRWIGTSLDGSMVLPVGISILKVRLGKGSTSVHRVLVGD